MHQLFRQTNFSAFTFSLDKYATWSPVSFAIRDDLLYVGISFHDPFPDAFFAIWFTESTCFQEEDKLDNCDGLALARRLPLLSSTCVELDANAALSVKSVSCVLSHRVLVDALRHSYPGEFEHYRLR